MSYLDYFQFVPAQFGRVSSIYPMKPDMGVSQVWQ